DGIMSMKNSVGSNNVRDGVHIFAAELCCPTGSTFKGNVFNSNGRDGAHGAFNGAMTFTSNQANLNGWKPDFCCDPYGNGFNFYDAFGAYLANNFASNNYNDGFRLRDWQYEGATKNTSNNNGDDGFDLRGNGCNGMFWKNKAAGNGSWSA